MINIPLNLIIKYDDDKEYIVKINEITNPL